MSVKSSSKQPAPKKTAVSVESKPHKKQLETPSHGPAFETLSAEGTFKKIRFEIPGKELLQSVVAYVQHKGSDFKMPGFRPGKVPFPQLQKRFGGLAWNEVPRALAENFLKRIAVQEKWRFVTQPTYDFKTHPTPDKPEDPLVVEVSFERQPQLPAYDLKTIKIDSVEAEIKTDDVKKLLQSWVKEHHKTVLTKEKRGAKQGDILLVDAVVTPKKGDPHQMKDTEITLDPERTKADFLNKFLDQKVGAVITEKIEISKNVKEKHLAGKRLPVKYTIKALKEKVPLKGKEELPETLGLKDAADVTQKARDILEQKGRELSFLWIKRQILDHLAEYTFDVPKRMVEEEYKKLWAEALKTANISDAHQPSKDHDKQMPTKKSAALKKAFGKSEQELQTFFQKVSERRVRLGFILSKVAVDLKVTVTREETQQVLFREVSRHPHHQQQVLDFYQKSPEALEALKAPVLENKVVQALLKKLEKKSERKLSLKEIETLLENEASVAGNV